MKPKVYVETTIISYLAARPSRDLIVAARQQLTVEWWQSRRDGFDLYVSQAVTDEAASGDPDAASRRGALLAGLPVLEPSTEIDRLAETLLSEGAIPRNAVVDAFHVAYAALNRIDYLLTWNITHIANAALRARIEMTCRRHGVSLPIICTPEELSQ